MFNQTLPCEEAKRLVGRGAQLVDVRSPLEYRQGALPGAVNVPLQAIHTAPDVLDENRPVILYCASGARSAHARRLLGGLGFDQVHDIGSFSRYFSCREDAS